MVGFGSDGARVLAASHAGKDVPYIRLKFKPTLSQLFYFYQNSSVRMSGLQASERLLQSPELKLKTVQSSTSKVSQQLLCLYCTLYKEMKT